MEEYKSQSIKTLESIIEIKEKERMKWANMVIKKQAIIEKLENFNHCRYQGTSLPKDK